MPTASDRPGVGEVPALVNAGLADALTPNTGSGDRRRNPEPQL
jgi:hypothetical protein